MSKAPASTHGRNCPITRRVRRRSNSSSRNRYDRTAAPNPVSTPTAPTADQYHTNGTAPATHGQAAAASSPSAPTTATAGTRNPRYTSVRVRWS